jgi:hypothetical protein
MDRSRYLRRDLRPRRGRSRCTRSGSPVSFANVTSPTTDPTQPRPPRQPGPVQYKGEDLDAARGPGLGCFRFQVVVLAVFIVLTPLSVVWQWPSAVSAALLFAVILLLLLTGQTIIFLLRLVSAERRGRRRPLASSTKTVGELEAEASAGAPEGGPAKSPDDAPSDNGATATRGDADPPASP